MRKGSTSTDKTHPIVRPLEQRAMSSNSKSLSLPNSVTLRAQTALLWGLTSPTERTRGVFTSLHWGDERGFQLTSSLDPGW